MSVVWRAHDQVLDREVAVKVLAGPAAPAAYPPDGIWIEARAVARLSHPHIASVFDYGEVVEEQGRCVPFVVMELLRGVSLAKLTGPGAMQPATAMRLCSQIAGALAAAHAEGLVHRDVKPGNIIVTLSGAKVFDFGIAAPVGTIDAPRPGEPVVGTVGYLAPERIVGGVVSPASDVYALGVLLYRLLTHEPPWPATTPSEIMVAHIHAEPPELPAIDGVPDDVAALFRACVAKDPGDRPSARQVAVALAAVVRMSPPLGDDVDVVSHPAVRAHDDLLGESPTTAIPETPLVRPVVTDAGGAPTPQPGPARRKVMLTSAGVASIAALGALLAFVIRPVPSDAEGTDVASAGSSAPALSVSATTRATDPTSPPSGRPSPPPAGTLPATVAAQGGVVVGTPPPPSGSPPAQGAGSPTSSPTAEPARTFTSAGGTVVATCVGVNAYLDSWTAADTFTVKSVVQGPAAEAVVRFKSKQTDITMTATCHDGTVAMGTSQT